MWTIIGAITLTSPFLLFFFKDKIEVTEDDLENERAEIKRKKEEDEIKRKNRQLLRERRDTSIKVAKKSNFNNLSIEEDKSFTLGNSIVRENEFTLCK